jgi:hypothetical protein
MLQTTYQRSGDGLLSATDVPVAPRGTRRPLAGDATDIPASTLISESAASSDQQNQ